MFDVEYRGGNCIQINTKEKSVILDGNLSILGIKNPKLKTGISIATDPRLMLNLEDGVSIDGPGEYEAGPFTIKGIKARLSIDSEGYRSTAYRIEVGDISIAVLGNIESKLTEDQLEQIGVVDILAVPVGGNGYTLDASDAVKLVRQVEPKIVIPVHYQDPALKYDVAQDSVDRFISELGAPVEKMPKLKIKNSSSIPTSITVYNLDLTL